MGKKRRTLRLLNAARAMSTMVRGSSGYTSFLPTNRGKHCLTKRKQRGASTSRTKRDKQAGQI